MSRARSMRHAVIAGVIVAELVVMSCFAQGQATPPATPAATPAVAGDCAGLGPYFLAVAEAVEGNAGYATMRTGAFNALSLSDETAAEAVTGLDTLIAEIEAIAPPEPADAWQAAFLEQLRWFRDLAANRDPLVHQRLINRDRDVYTQLGQAVLAGQMACGHEVWDTAWEAAFGEE